MKQTMKLLLVAVLATAMVAFVGCDKEEESVVVNNNENNGNNGGGNENDFDTVVWVDLGLPSGLLWAKCNVDATTPEDNGDYFAWGETQPKDVYNWSTYRYCTVDEGGALATLTKYNTSEGYGTVDNLTTLQSGDDAATARMGNGARIPTQEEWQELISNTTAEWTTVNNVNGRKFTATNGKSLFLPVAGYRQDTETYLEDYGNYTSASLNAGNPIRVWCFYFFSDGQSMDSSYYSRRSGLSVRAVRARK